MKGAAGSLTEDLRSFCTRTLNVVHNDISRVSGTGEEVLPEALPAALPAHPRPFVAWFSFCKKTRYQVSNNEPLVTLNSHYSHSDVEQMVT